MLEELIGKKETQQWTVTKDLLASSLKSGTVNVFATPYMIALMEYTCMTLIQPALPEGITTVGTLVNITHLNPTPEGAVARAQAELIETDGRHFVFKVTAYDDSGVIGEGIHERHSIKRDRFEEKAQSRLKPQDQTV